MLRINEISTHTLDVYGVKCAKDLFARTGQPWNFNEWTITFCHPCLSVIHAYKIQVWLLLMAGESNFTKANVQYYTYWMKPLKFESMELEPKLGIVNTLNCPYTDSTFGECQDYRRVSWIHDRACSIIGLHVPVNPVYSLSFHATCYPSMCLA